MTTHLGHAELVEARAMTLKKNNIESLFSDSGDFNTFAIAMETTRQNKVSRLLQKELGEIFQRESRTLFAGAFITVTKVRISPDLSVAKVYLSFFSVKDTAALLKKIAEETKTIRRTLGDKIKTQVRIIPNLSFFIDDSLDYLEKIESLLKK